MTYSQMLEEIFQLKKRGLSDAAADKYIEQLTKGRDIETDQNKASTDNLRRSVDEGLISGVQDINRFALNAGLTTKQRDEIVSYYEDSGPEGALYQARSKVDAALKFYNQGKGLDKNPEFYDQFMKAMVPGQKLTEDYIRKTVAVLLTGCERKSAWYPGYGKNMTYSEAVAAGHGDEWLPDPSPEEIKAIRNQASAQGLNNLSDMDIRWIKKKMMGLPVPEGKIKGNK